MSPDRSAILPVYAPPEIVFTHGEGAHLIAEDGSRHLDFIAGIAVNALGYSHPAAVGALKAQADRIWHLSNMFRIPGQEELARRYVADSFADVVFFTNSGTEAIECALKMARKAHYSAGHPERLGFLGFEGSFHGRSLGAINAAGNPKYLEGFGPALPGFRHLPYCDLEAIRAAITPETAALIIEPVQGEGGCRALPEDFLRDLRQICDEAGIFLIFDEVQCGAGRTGKLFAHEWAGITPDIMAIAKGVGAGFPMGACLATHRASAGMAVGSHGSTFGGNALAMAVGLAVWTEITRPEFLAHVREMSSRLGQSLEGLKARFPDLVLETRGKGLLRGLRLAIDPKPVQIAARAEKLLVGVAGENTLRLAPPLIIGPAEVQEAVEKLDLALGTIAAARAA